MKAGDSGKRRVGVNGHFLILLSLTFENSEGDRGPLKEPLIQQHTFLKHGLVDFVLCSVQGFAFNDLPGIFFFFLRKDNVPSCSIDHSVQRLLILNLQ